MREYFVKPAKADDDDWWEPTVTFGPTIQVIETEESVDTGVLDAAGNRIHMRERKNPVGFIWPR